MRFYQLIQGGILLNPYIKTMFNQNVRFVGFQGSFNKLQENNGIQRGIHVQITHTHIVEVENLLPQEGFEQNPKSRKILAFDLQIHRKQGFTELEHV